MDDKCIKCLIKAQMDCINGNASCETKVDFLFSFFRLLEEKSKALKTAELFHEATVLRKKYFGITQDFKIEKEYSNQLVLELEKQIKTKILLSNNPIYTAFKYALVGNIIDFAVIPSMSLCETLINEIYSVVSGLNLEKTDIFSDFLEEMSRSKKIVYITDNCGEIVFDRLFIEELKKIYKIDVTVIARGSDVINDATSRDLQLIGFEKHAKILSNGTPFAGTVLEKITAEAKSEIERADLIISKGQGNFETLYGCGYNVYYAFLCKCTKLCEQFEVAKNTGVFIKETIKEGRKQCTQV